MIYVNFKRCDDVKFRVASRSHIVGELGMLKKKDSRESLDFRDVN